MTDPVRAADEPYSVEVQEGRNYFWCSCGKSAKQPFCDGAHLGTDFMPVRYKAVKTETLFFCGCKATNNQPFCDGSHKA